MKPFRNLGALPNAGITAGIYSDEFYRMLIHIERDWTSAASGAILESQRMPLQSKGIVLMQNLTTRCRAACKIILNDFLTKKNISHIFFNIFEFLGGWDERIAYQ